MSTGDNIRNEREQQRMSRGQLGKGIGKSADLIGKYERGIRKIGVVDLAKVAKLLGRPMEFFIDEVQDIESDLEKRLEELMQLAGLEPRNRAILRSISTRAIEEAMVDLIDRLEGRQPGIFRQEVLEAETELKVDGSCQRWSWRRIEVLKQEMAVLNLTNTHNHSIWDFKASLLHERCRYERGKIELGVDHNRGGESVVSIRFHPPLMSGDVVDLCCHESYKGNYWMSRKEVERFGGKELYFVGGKEKCTLNVAVPTHSLRNRISFPEDYEVTDIDAGVFFSRMRLTDECNRLKREMCLSKMKMGSRWMLELSVKQPMVGADYDVNWLPPTEDAFRKLLSKKQLADRKKLFQWY